MGNFVAPYPKMVTFPNGEVLTSSALTPVQLETILQPIIANILGISTDPSDPSAPSPTDPSQQPWTTVRISWQRRGQPAFVIQENVCVLRATPESPLYSRIREQLIGPNDNVSVNRQMQYTQTWNVHFVLYGSNSFDMARTIISAQAIDWVNDAIQLNNLYFIEEYNRPQYAPENENGQWWERNDVTLRFYENVRETLSVPTAASVQVTLDTDQPFTETILIQQ